MNDTRTTVNEEKRAIHKNERAGTELANRKAVQDGPPGSYATHSNQRNAEIAGWRQRAQSTEYIPCR